MVTGCPFEKRAAVRTNWRWSEDAAAEITHSGAADAAEACGSALAGARAQSTATSAAADIRGARDDTPIGRILRNPACRNVPAPHSRPQLVPEHFLRAGN